MIEETIQSLPDKETYLRFVKRVLTEENRVASLITIISGASPALVTNYNLNDNETQHYTPLYAEKLPNGRYKIMTAQSDFFHDVQYTPNLDIEEFKQILEEYITPLRTWKIKSTQTKDLEQYDKDAEKLVTQLGGPKRIGDIDVNVKKQYNVLYNYDLKGRFMQEFKRRVGKENIKHIRRRTYKDTSDTFSWWEVDLSNIKKDDPTILYQRAKKKEYATPEEEMLDTGQFKERIYDGNMKSFYISSSGEGARILRMGSFEIDQVVKNYEEAVDLLLKERDNLWVEFTFVSKDGTEWEKGNKLTDKTIAEIGDAVERVIEQRRLWEEGKKDEIKFHKRIKQFPVGLSMRPAMGWEAYNKQKEDKRFQRQIRAPMDELRKEHGITYTTKVLDDLGRMLKASPDMIVKTQRFFKNKIENEWKGFKQVELDLARETLDLFQQQEKIKLRDYVKAYLSALLWFNTYRTNKYEAFGLKNMGRPAGWVLNRVNVIQMELDPYRHFAVDDIFTTYPIDTLKYPLKDDYLRYTNFVGTHHGGQSFTKSFGTAHYEYRPTGSRLHGEVIGHYRSFTEELGLDQVFYVAEMQSDFASRLGVELKAHTNYMKSHDGKVHPYHDITIKLGNLLKETYTIPIVDEIIKDTLRNIPNKKVRIATPATAMFVEFNQTIGGDVKQVEDMTTLKVGKFRIGDERQIDSSRWLRDAGFVIFDEVTEETHTPRVTPHLDGIVAAPNKEVFVEAVLGNRAKEDSHYQEKIFAEITGNMIRLINPADQQPIHAYPLYAERAGDFYRIMALPESANSIFNTMYQIEENVIPITTWEYKDVKNELGDLESINKDAEKLVVSKGGPKRTGDVDAGVHHRYNVLYNYDLKGRFMQEFKRRVGMENIKHVVDDSDQKLSWWEVDLSKIKPDSPTFLYQRGKETPESEPMGEETAPTTKPLGTDTQKKMDELGLENEDAMTEAEIVELAITGNNPTGNKVKYWGGKFKEGAVSFQIGARKILRPMSDVLKHHFPETSYQLDKLYDNHLTRNLQTALTALKPYKNKYNDLTNQDKLLLKHLYLTETEDKGVRLQEFLEKHDMVAEDQVRKDYLEAIHKEITGIGVDIGYVENYHPRRLRAGAAPAFIAELQQSELAGEIEIAVRNENDSRILAGLKKMDDKELGIFLQEFMEKEVFVPEGIVKRLGIEKRRLRELEGSWLKYYKDPFDSLLDYMNEMERMKSASNFFGEGLAIVDGKISPSISISNYVEKQRLKDPDNKINKKYYNELEGDMRILFQPKTNSRIISEIKGATYITTLGNIHNAMVQAEEIAVAYALFGPVKATQGLFRTFFGGKDRIRWQDIYGDSIIYEMRDDPNGTLMKAFSELIKWSGFRFSDFSAKGVKLNAGYIAYQSWAESGKLSEENLENRGFWDYVVVDRYLDNFKRLFPTIEQRDKVRQDLLDGKMTDDIKDLLTQIVKDTEAIGEMQVPFTKNEGQSILQLLYVLKTFTIRRISWIYEYALRDIQEGDALQKARGVRRLVPTIFFLILMGFGVNEIIDLIKQEDEPLEDKVKESLYRPFGFSRYYLWKAQLEGVIPATFDYAFFPPSLGIPEDFLRLFEGDPRIVHRIPLIGGPIYYWFLDEIGKNERIPANPYRNNNTSINPFTENTNFKPKI